MAAVGDVEPAAFEMRPAEQFEQEQAWSRLLPLVDQPPQRITLQQPIDDMGANGGALYYRF